MVSFIVRRFFEGLLVLVAVAAVAFVLFQFVGDPVAQMLPMDEFEARMEQMVQELESAPLAKNAQKIFVPGEMEWAKREKALAENRLELADNMAENLEKAAALTKTSLHWLAD